MVTTITKPNLYLPESITGQPQTKLPEAEVVKTYVRNPINCDEVLVLISVKDKIFKDSNGKLVGYWYNNDTVSGLLNVRVELSPPTTSSGGGFFANLAARANSFAATISLTKEECIDPITEDFSLESGGENLKTFHFLVKLSHPEQSNFPTNRDSFFHEIAKARTTVFVHSSDIRERYQTTQNVTINPTIVDFASGDLNPLYYDLVTEQGLTAYEVNSPTLTNSSFASPHNKRMISDLKMSVKQNGDIAGTFSLDVESLIRKGSSYSAWIDTISENKKNDIIEAIKKDYSTEIINSISVVRTRVSEASQDSINFSEPFEERNPEELIIKTSGDVSIENSVASFFTLDIHLDQPESANYRHYSFVDKQAKENNGSRFKYSISIDLNIDNVVDKILRKGYSLFKQKKENIISYYRHFLVNNLVIPNTDFYDMGHPQKKNMILGHHAESVDILVNSLSTIVDYLMNYNQTSQQVSQEILTDLFDNMDPNKNPNIEILAQLVTNLQNIDSKINKFLFSPVKTSDTTDTGAVVTDDQSRFKFNTVEKSFFESVKIGKVFKGMQYFPTLDTSFPAISGQQFSDRVREEEERYSATRSRDTGVNPGDLKQSDKNSHMTPMLFVSGKEKHDIYNLPVYSFAELNNAMRKFSTSKTRTDSKEIFQLPEIILEILMGEKNSKAFKQNLKNYIARKKSLTMVTLPKTEVSDTQSNYSPIEEIEETKFYLGLLRNELLKAASLSPKLLEETSLTRSGNELVNLAGETRQVDIRDFISSIPYQFHSFYAEPKDWFSNISDTFSSGYGVFLYYLTLQRTSKVEFLQKISSSGEEEWGVISKDALRRYRGKNILCKISPVQSEELGFKTDESTPVINKYFLLGL